MRSSSAMPTKLKVSTFVKLASIQCAQNESKYDKKGSMNQGGSNAHKVQAID